MPMTSAKPIPRRTPSNLLPPNERYTYRTPAGVAERPYGFFEGRGRMPFEAGAKGWSAVNASWLADAALLAYEPSGDARTRTYREAGFDATDLSGGRTLCTVAHAVEAVVVAFRGTRVPKGDVSLAGVLGDVLTDMSVGKTEESGRGRVHRGFHAALEAVWTPLGDTLRRLGPARPVWFTGHSLGAALAMLAAARHGGPAGVYAFGAPCVGDRAFAQSLRGAPVIRVVHGADAVTRLLPGWLGYVHAGEPRYVATDGRLRGDAPRGFPSLNDHAPLFYGVHLWNLAVGPVNGLARPS
jgi:hypothetical protein